MRDLSIFLLGASVLALALLAAYILAPRRDGTTAMERLIRLLYRWASWWSCFAQAMDAGYLRFRMERRLARVEPENERLGETLEPASER